MKSRQATNLMFIGPCIILIVEVIIKQVASSWSPFTQLTSYKICRCKFRFDGSTQRGIKLGLQMVRIVLMYDNYKYSVKGVENRDT